MRKIGYARVSAQHQNLDRQLGALVAEGCERVASGKSTMGRPQLEKAIAALGPATCRCCRNGIAPRDRCSTAFKSFSASLRVALW